MTNEYIRLFNIGNSCYLNSALQCILDNKIFVKYLKQILEITRGKSRENLNGCSLIYIILDLVNRSKNGTVSPVNLKQFLGKYNEMFRNNIQQDCHECLVSILDIIHEETKNIKNVTPVYQNPKSQKIMKANSQWESFNNVFGYSFVTHLFSGQFVSTVYCMNCKQENYSFDAFNTITLNIPGSDNNSKLFDITDCFYNYFKEETLDSLIECEHCKLMTRMSKRLSIWRFPKVMIITLKRYDGTNNRNNTQIEVNENIQFKKENNSNLIYNLQCIVNHEGSSQFAGHYTTTVIKDGKWALIDDETVTPIHKVKQSKAAYILVYMAK